VRREAASVVWRREPPHTTASNGVRGRCFLAGSVEPVQFIQLADPNMGWVGNSKMLVISGVIAVSLIVDAVVSFSLFKTKHGRKIAGVG
jgi:hypothetical protein